MWSWKLSITSNDQRLKELFTQQVDSIVWKHKLSRETIRLDPKDEIEEIQVFDIYLKEDTYSSDLLQSIDRSLPYPILHVLRFQEHVKLAIAYKKRNQADDDRAVVHSYHESEWQPAAQFQFHLIQGLDLKAVYEHIIRSLLAVKVSPNEEIAVAIEQQAHIEKLTSECQRLESKIRSERQFNRKVELNMELQRKRKQFKNLKDHR